MVCLSLDSIRRACRPDVGIASLRYAVSADMAVIAPVLTTTYLADYPLGVEFFDIEADAGITWRESQSRSEHGDRYDQSISFSVRQLRSEVTDTLMKLRHRRISIELTSTDGARYFFPSLRILTDRELGPNQNGYRIRLEGTTAAPAQALPSKYVAPIGNTWGNPVTNEVWGNPDQNTVWGW